ncbi:hypothetical protein [Egicoccus sp. AB-alg2]|uniref:Mu transposase domain-containing protein n=1 Tax=Egicoccus sp. AB-alg2 TaxID=3242693 RepID=UPI00359D4353
MGPRAGVLKPLSNPLPDVSRQIETRVSKDCFGRMAAVDYRSRPVWPAAHVQLKVGLERVAVWLERDRIAEHDRSWIRRRGHGTDPPATAARAPRSPPEPSRRDPALPTPNLAVWGAVAGAF